LALVLAILVNEAPRHAAALAVAHVAGIVAIRIDQTPERAVTVVVAV
jgi:hypothetical protein